MGATIEFDFTDENGVHTSSSIYLSEQELIELIMQKSYAENNIIVTDVY